MRPRNRGAVYAVAALLLGAFLSSHGEAPITLETLTTLRAAQRMGGATPLSGGMDEQGKPFIVEDAKADQGSAILALKKTYEVPFCVEYAYAHPPAPEIRFPFTIYPNQRLVDALDDIEEKSGRAIQWRLLTGRIILTAHQPQSRDEIHVMDRRVKTEIKAEVLWDVFEQLETAYNEQYVDIPLIVEPSCLEHVFAVLSADCLSFDGEAPMREIVLSLLDQTEDPWLCYGLSESFDKNNRRYFSLRIRRFDCRDDFADAEEYRKFKALLRASTERREEYLERAARSRSATTAIESATPAASRVERPEE